MRNDKILSSVFIAGAVTKLQTHHDLFYSTEYEIFNRNCKYNRCVELATHAIVHIFDICLMN